MRNKLTLFIPLILLLALAMVIPVSSFATPSAQNLAAPIRLKAATFTPAAGEAASVPAGLAVAGYAQGQRGYYIVQFQGPVQQAWKDAVAAAGGELLEYIPEFSFKVRMTPAQAAQVQGVGNVAWVGLFHPAYKLSPDLVRDGTHLYTVRVERGASAGLAAAAIAQSGAEVLAQEGNVLHVAADSAQLDAIARVTDVAWVQNFTLHEKHNEYGAGVIIGANTANVNYDGSTQIAAVADTGLGGGTASTAHPDIPSGRVTAIYDWPGVSNSCYNAINDGAIDVDSGHGTHVAVSVLGDGGSSGEGRGTAPSARLVFQAVEDWADMKGLCAIQNPDGYYLIGIPADLRPLFQQAYDVGARIHSNSWGSSVAGDYTLDSANTDDFIWNHRDMVITFSAGNSGADANGDGVVDNDSIGSPATAKNVITVGASENDRQGHYECDTNLTYTSYDAYQSGKTCQSMGGQNILGTWGSRYGFTGPMANDPTAGNQEQMAGWSSRGPTDDNRIKPDVVAPGTWILSGFSGLYQEGYGDPVNPQNGLHQWDGWGMPYNVAYKYMGGTSMSNPITAGAATVVRDFYNKAHNHDASAALVKATLINSAVDMLDENNDGANDNDFPIPNNHEGWGRVNLVNATDVNNQFVDNTTGIGTGATASYQLNVGSSGSPFKVTLVWSDYPSTEAASVNLVNNLNLVVRGPGGSPVYNGNVFSGGWSTTGGSADTRNNVENVYVQSAAAGTWTVEVTGANVPNGPQPFALVVDGNFGAAPTPTNTPTPGPTATPTNTPAPTNTPIATATPGSATSVHVGDLDGAGVNNGSTWTANVTITVHDNNHNPVSGATVSSSWSNGASGSDSCTTDGNGQCTLSKSGIRKNVSSVTFTVSSVTYSTLTYNSGANHDPDNDSNGTSITVSKP